MGVNARVHCTQYTGSIEYNGTDGLSKSTVNVDSNGVQNQSVIQDVSFNNVTESVTFSVIRTLKRFEINSVQEWEWQEDLISSV